MERVKVDDLLKMDVNGLIAVKQAWSREAVKGFYFDGLIRIATLLGNRITFPRRETVPGWYWVIPHPTLKAAFIKVIYFDQIISYDIYGTSPDPADNWSHKQVLIVTIGGNPNQWFSGVKIAHWCNRHQDEDNLFIPGDWWDILGPNLKEANMRYEVNQDKENQEEWQKVFTELEPYGTF